MLRTESGHGSVLAGLIGRAGRRGRGGQHAGERGAARVLVAGNAVEQLLGCAPA